MSTRWEYVARHFHEPSVFPSRVAPEASTLTGLLGAEGEQGWELVAYDFSTGMAVFKRPVL